VKKILQSEYEMHTRSAKKVYSNGTGTSWEVEIFYNDKNRHYYLKGPFGRWDTFCFYDFGEQTADEVEGWIEEFEKTNSRQNEVDIKDLS
jgi:hypothetical protein